MNKSDLGGLSDSCGSPQNLRLLAGYRLPVRQHTGILTQLQAKVKGFLRFFRVITSLLLPDCTSSMYNSTPPCGGQITPCTNPKLRAKMEFDWGE